MITPHNLRWGECLAAIPPPPVPVGNAPVGDENPDCPEMDEESDQDKRVEKVIEIYSDEQNEAPVQDPVGFPPTVAAVREDSGYVSVDKMTQMPHACITLLDAAIAGSYGELTETGVPESIGETITDDEFEFDDDYVLRRPGVRRLMILWRKLERSPMQMRCIMMTLMIVK